MLCKNRPMRLTMTSGVRRLFTAGLAAALASMLSACGGGGGGADATPTPTEPPPSSLTLNLPRHGLQASDLAVIVAEGDALSEGAAAHYQTVRGIPAANIIKVRLPGTGDAISAAAFATLRAEIEAKLPAGIQATLLTWAAPSRVTGSCSMSITSAMAFGFDEKYCRSTCGATAASPYYDSEAAQPFADHGMRPAMLLGARTLDEARRLIDRGRAADASNPAGDGYLLRTSDAARSVRFDDFAPLPAQWAGRLALNYLETDTLGGRSAVLFYFTGLPRVTDLGASSYRPGAVGDALTSYAGLLPTAQGQTPVTEWLEAGLTGSYGTVEEPCNHPQKFPRASVLIDQYWRGATLIEAYWKSVQWPGQGLFVGEPLARPWPDAPSLRIEGGRYVIEGRGLRAGASYALEYRTTANGAWTSLATFTIATAGPQTLTAPLAPGSALQIRWVGPCPADRGQRCTLATST